MSHRSRRLIDREEVVADHGVVATKHPLEAEAGLRVLRDGGNAIDAAVAVGALAWVVEPWMVCIGGIGFLLYHEAASGRSYSVEFPPRAPRAATPDLYRWIEGPPRWGLSVHDVEGDENIYGYRSVAVPGNVAGLCEAHRRWGVLPLARVLEPAIQLAEEGYDADWYVNAYIAAGLGQLQKFPATAEVYLPGGAPAPLRTPTRIQHRDLAATLRAIARGGPEVFYRGEVAEAIDADFRRHGGLLSREDLAAYEVSVREPLRGRYRGYEVLIPNAPGGHWTELQTLKVLENFDLPGLTHNSVAGLHTFIEAARQAFADRYYHMADPDFEPVPLRGLLSEGYGRALAALVDPQQAQLEDGEEQPVVAFAHRALHDPWAYDPAGSAPKSFQAAAAGPERGHTTHFSIIDQDRNVVSCTETAGESFGSVVTVPGTGVLLNDGMVWFNPKPGAANSVAGGKRPLVNMGPMLVLKDGRPFLGLGAPGGRRIISCVVQTLSNVVDHGMSIQRAVGAPRVDCSTAETFYDDRLDGAVVEGLVAKDHRMTPVSEEMNPLGWEFAHPVCVMVDEGGRLRAGVDPFRLAEARGY